MRTANEAWQMWHLRWKRVAAVLAMAPLVLIATVAVARADATDDYVHRQMEKKKIPGLALAVIRDGHVVKEAASCNWSKRGGFLSMSP